MLMNLGISQNIISYIAGQKINLYNSFGKLFGNLYKNQIMLTLFLSQSDSRYIPRINKIISPLKNNYKSISNSI